MQFIKIGDRIVNKNQIQYIEKYRSKAYDSKLEGFTFIYGICIVLQYLEDEDCDMNFETEEERDKVFEELFQKLNS